MATQYKKHTHREHILELPDTYIGSIDTTIENRWVYNQSKNEMEWRIVHFCPGFLKIFDEILVNALDHRVRMSIRGGDTIPVKHIDVTLTDTSITVRNDGDGIPVEIHSETGLWAPELIFGNLLTSSNYDKSEEKIVGGKNGYGAKLASVFSSSFTVETVDHRNKKKYIQTWTNNMSSVGKPQITNCEKKPYTEIRFVPDLTRFHWSSTSSVSTIPSDMIAVLATRVIDAAASAGKECKVSLNGTTVGTNTFPKYIDLYLTTCDGSSAGSEEGIKRESKRIAYESAGVRWEIGAILTKHLHGDTPPDERHISFVNGIATRRGGKHVDYVVKSCLGMFCEYAKKKAKLEITPSLLKDSVVWFVNATIVNPSFDTQTKETLTTPAAKFGSTPEISNKFIELLGKIGLLDEAAALLDAKTAKEARKTDGKKRSVLRGIPKLDDATWAGTSKSVECTLILTEGDSAKTTAISGLKVVGRERYGVFPLKGKILNVKDISADKKAKNEELTHIKQILGLETGRVYTDLKQLRYGRVMIMTDQDVDGSHIKGLLMNLFHTEWPSLLRLGFLCCLMTPLLKATRGSQTLCFYSESEYEAWKVAQGDGLRGWSTKYYKGLGTSTAAEAREYFSTMNTVEYIWDDVSSNDAIDLAFNKKRANDRKVWLSTFDRSRHLEVKAGGARVDYGRFVHDELIHFSNEDNIRSIPHVMDGLKPSLRKILWSAMKRNLTHEIRVAQLAGYVSEKAAYHHGEASLTGAIVGMAQNFVGSNNLNLLLPNGQFGTRLMGGKDAASARYIHTALSPIVKYIYHKSDDDILKYTQDDGIPVEPITYLPVIPMLLVNGTIGIGTGFSSTVLPYNPDDIVGALRCRLQGATHDLSDMKLTPWWFGFKGRVIQGKDTSTWITRGNYEFIDDDRALVRITELPIGKWTSDYKDFLEEMLIEQEKNKTDIKPKLRGYTANYNDVDVDFILELDVDYYHTCRAYPSEFESDFELCTSHKTTNYVAFGNNNKIRHYKSVGEILEEFYNARIRGYIDRKEHELKHLDDVIRELSARLTFVRAVVEKRLTVANASDEDLYAGLTALGLPTLSEGDGLRGYEYLLKMRIDRIKAEAVRELEKEVAVNISTRDKLAGTAIETLWLEDLAEFAKGWVEYSNERMKAYTSLPTTTTKKSKAKKKTN